MKFIQIPPPPSTTKINEEYKTTEHKEDDNLYEIEKDYSHLNLLQKLKDKYKHLEIKEENSQFPQKNSDVPIFGVKIFIKNSIS